MVEAGLRSAGREENIGLERFTNLTVRVSYYVGDGSMTGRSVSRFLSYDLDEWTISPWLRTLTR